MAGKPVAASFRCGLRWFSGRRWCSGRRRARPPARSPHASFARSGRSRSPPVPSGPSGALHTSGTWCADVWLCFVLKPGQAPPLPTGTAAWSSIPPAPFTPVGPLRLLLRGASTRCPARPRRCPRAPQPGPVSLRRPPHPRRLVRSWAAAASLMVLLAAPLVFRAPSGPAAREIATREPDGSEWSISKPARALRTLRHPPHPRRVVR